MTGMGKLMRVAERGPFRPADAEAVGIPRTYLQRWTQQGVLERVGRGLYRLVASEPSELAPIAEVARRAPRGIVCLLSALELHELTSESPSAVWLMVEGHSRAPRIDFVRTEIVRASGVAFHHGVERRVIEGVPVRVTSPAKTVVDCFRYRRHVGLEVALDALRDYMKATHARRAPQYAVKHLTEAMRASRVTSVMRPYVEALV
jgi:predicted transcriptional regulator of viral defense system